MISQGPVAIWCSNNRKAPILNLMFESMKKLYNTTPTCLYKFLEQDFGMDSSKFWNQIE